MKNPKSIRLDETTKAKLDEIEIETTGVKLNTYDDKINFLIWFYGSHRNNN